jgi:ABC-type nitrate/sulfonate/bicarbonate transport system permease component
MARLPLRTIENGPEAAKAVLETAEKNNGFLSNLLRLLAFAAVWPILLNTAAGVRQLDPQWLLLSRSLAATQWETIVRVVVPGVLSATC